MSKENIPQNALVGFRPGYAEWVESQTDIQDKVKELAKEQRFFYLGDVPNIPGIAITLSVKTGLAHALFHTEDLWPVT